MKRSYSFFGIISLVVMVIILIMTCFAVLTYLNSRNDLDLTRKAAQTVSAYYKADLVARERFILLEDLLEKDVSLNELTAEGFTIENEDGISKALFKTPIDEKRFIVSEVLLRGNQTGEIISWKIVLE